MVHRRIRQLIRRQLLGRVAQQGVTFGPDRVRMKQRLPIHFAILQLALRYNFDQLFFRLLIELYSLLLRQTGSGQRQMLLMTGRAILPAAVARESFFDAIAVCWSGGIAAAIAALTVSRSSLAGK